MSAPPTYRLLPNFDYRPNQALRLGTLLTEDKHTALADPSDPITEVYISPPDSKINTTIQEHRPDNEGGHSDDGRIWKYNDKVSSSGTWDLSADLSLLPGLSSAGIGSRRSQTQGISITCNKMTTTSFQPDKEYKWKILQEIHGQPHILNLLRSSWDLRRPWLYLITGLKVAENAAVEYTWERTVEGQGSLGIDASAMGVPVKIGPSESGSRGREGAQTEFREEPFVLAYRLIRLRPKGDEEFREKGDRKKGRFLYDDEIVGGEEEEGHLEGLWEVEDDGVAWYG